MAGFTEGDDEAEKIGREYAAKRCHEPREYVLHGNNGPVTLVYWVSLDSPLAGMMRDGHGRAEEYRNETAAFVALGRAVQLGREVFA